MLEQKSPSHFTRHLQPQTRKIESLPLSRLRPNRRHGMDRAASRTRQSPMPPSLISPSNFFLRLSHPVRNNEDTYQLLDGNAPTLRHLLQLKENTTIKNMHELHGLFTIAHLRSTSPNHANTRPLYMAHLLFLENNVQSVQQSIKSQPNSCQIHASMLPRSSKESRSQRRPNPETSSRRYSHPDGSQRDMRNRPGKNRRPARPRRNTRT